jgi:hypothetical protein
MNLTHRNQRPKCLATFARTVSLALDIAADRSKLAKKRCPVAVYRGPGVVFGEAEIEIALPVCAGGPSHARRKAVDQPGKLAEVRGTQN